MLELFFFLLLLFLILKNIKVFSITRYLKVSLILFDVSSCYSGRARPTKRTEGLGTWPHQFCSGGMWKW